MKDVGYSNKVFFYNGAGHSFTYDFRMRICLTSSPDLGALERAAEKTMALFPEFAIRPLIGEDGRLYYEENRGKVAILPESDPPHALGSEETGGFLLCLLYDERSFTLSFFHGLSDFYGNWRFIQTLIYHYVLECGGEVLSPAPEVRRSAEEYYSIPLQEREDPYSHFGDESLTPDWVYEDRGVMHIQEEIYPDEADQLRAFVLTLPVSDFLRKTKEVKASFASLVIMLVSRALERVYGESDQPVVVKIPANLRSLYDTKTTANFSDSLVLSLDKNLRQQSLTEQGLFLRRSMDAQLHRNNYSHMFLKKIRRVKEYETCGKSIYELNQEMTNQLSSESARPVTFALTYPGRLEVPEELRPYIQGFNMEPYVPTNGFFLFMGSYGKELRIRICQRFDSDRLARAIKDCFCELGLPATLSDAGYTTGDKVYVDRLKTLKR